MTIRGAALGRGARNALYAVLACAIAVPAWAGSFDLFGVNTEYKVTLGYAIAERMKSADQNLVNGPVDTMQIDFTPVATATCFNPPCLGKFGHTGLPTTANFDDGNRDFKKGALLNNRVSGYGEVQFHLDNLGIGDVGAVFSGAAHYDNVFEQTYNDHDNPATVNRVYVDADGNRHGPHNTWLPADKEWNGYRHRLLEAYGYGQWYLTDTIALSLRAGKHLAAWGESLFFPGIVSAQGPFDATKANVPGVEVKEILLPVNQVSMQLALTNDLTALAYDQFEFQPTEIFPQGDFFSPADLIGPGATFGIGSINPISPQHCAEPVVTDSTTGQPISGSPMCQVASGFNNQPEYIMTTRTADQIPNASGQWGVGLKYQLTSNFNLGAYYLNYNNHNPEVLLNMGYAYLGNDNASNSRTTTQTFNVRVPTTYTVAYADNIHMEALSFSTVFWVFNVGGELIRKDNVDTSLESTIAGVVSPWATRGTTDQFQMSLLYVNNPDFIFDEVVMVTEMGYMTVEKTTPQQNQDGVCMSGTSASDCNGPWKEKGNVLFYDKNTAAMQMLVMPKARNVFSGWDLSTPLTFSWLALGTPSTPGVWGPLYGEGDMRAGLALTGQYLQNLELSLGYNAYFGNSDKNINHSLLRANPYADHDYASFTVKYNL